MGTFYGFENTQGQGNLFGMHSIKFTLLNRFFSNNNAISRSLAKFFMLSSCFAKDPLHLWGKFSIFHLGRWYVLKTKFVKIQFHFKQQKIK